VTEEPSLDKTRLWETVASEYQIPVMSLEFLPLGSDVRSFSYKLVDAGGTEFYLKLRSPSEVRTPLLPAAAFVMNHLAGAIRPLSPQASSRFWLEFDSYQLFLYPFVPGVPGWEYTLSDGQWREIGAIVRSLHGLVLPPSVAEGVPRDTFGNLWRKRLIRYVERGRPGFDAGSRALAALLREKRAVLTDIARRAQNLSAKLAAASLESVCCHGDLHSGNFLLDEVGKVHLVDWDTLSFAPPEKDLMFVEGGIGGMLDAKGGAALFHEGYGPSRVNADALRYFRWERIVQDVVAYCEQLLDSSEGGTDRATMVEQLTGQFAPGGVVDVAYAT